ncbi:MAG: hypothetical protein WCW31_05070 [Patescibacteria group bacterium]
MFRRFIGWLSLIAVLALWLVFLMPWHGFPDPDALYHATYSNLMALGSPLIKGGQGGFPWLDLTILGTHFADQHFLFHVLQMPFVKLFGILQGSRISSIVFAIICLLGLGIVFKKFTIKHFAFWILLLAVSQPFCTRLIQGKASPLAILVWFVGIALALLSVIARNELDERRGNLTRFYCLSGIFICSLIFTLLHGGWILLPISLFLIWLGDLIFKKIVPQSVMPNSIRHPDTLLHGNEILKRVQDDKWRGLILVVVSLLGILFGILIHPGRAQLLNLFWIQVVQIGIFTPVNLNMGNEWSPASWQSVVGLFAVPGILLIIGMIGIFIAPKKQPLDLHTKSVLILSPLIAFLFAISLKSLRYAEYFQPLFCFWVALILQWTDWKQFFSTLNLQIPTRYFLLPTSYLLKFLIVFCVTVTAVSNAYGAYTSMHGKLTFIDTTYQMPMLIIASIAKPGDRVFHAQWDEFPSLFYLNQNLKYVSGLDPTFLYDASTTLAIDYSKFSYNAASTTKDFAWSLIHDRTGSKFVLVDTNRWGALDALIASDPRYTKIAQGDGARAYQITENP